MPELPEGWLELSLGDTGTWLSGGTPATNEPRFWGGDIPWISAASLKDFRLRDSDRRVTRAGSQAGTRLVPQGSVLFVVRGMSLKTEFRVGVAQRELTFGQDCKAIIPKNGIDGTFLALAIRARTRAILGMVDEAGHGTGRLPTDLISRLSIAVPPLSEQRRIVAILGAIDDELRTLGRLLKKRDRELRAASMEVVRAAYIASGVAQGSLSALGDVLAMEPGGFIQTGPFGSQLHSYDYVADGIPVVMPQDIIKQSISDVNIARVSNVKARELSRHVLQVGDVVFARRGDVSRCALVMSSEEGWLCGTGCLQVRVARRVVLPEWLALVYQDDYCQRQIMAAAVGTTMVNLNTKVLSRLKIPIPSIPQQRNILEMLHRRREIVKRETQQMKKLTLVQKGIMEGLLSGSVSTRVGI